MLDGFCVSAYLSRITVTAALDGDDLVADTSSWTFFHSVGKSLQHHPFRHSVGVALPLELIQKPKDLNGIPVVNHTKLYHALHSLDVFTALSSKLSILTLRLDYKAVRMAVDNDVDVTIHFGCV